MSIFPLYLFRTAAIFWEIILCKKSFAAMIKLFALFTEC